MRERYAGSKVLVFTVYGSIHARHIDTTDYVETVDKACAGRKELRVALVADLHLCYNSGLSQAKRSSEAGADLDLSGHTHDGQIFPGNLVTGIMWENSCGYKKIGNMNSVVTSGAGVWGPPLRVGTKSEVCQITVRFSGK